MVEKKIITRKKEKKSSIKEKYFIYLLLNYFLENI